MKNKNFIIVLIVSLIVLAAACFFALLEEMRRDGEAETFSGRAEIMLRAGEEKKAGNLNIKMIEITGDSRCPIDVKCIWAGKVSANIELRLRKVVIATTLNIESNPYVFENYLIKLINVKPEKVQNREIIQAEYIATFLIETIDGNGTENGGSRKIR